MGVVSDDLPDEEDRDAWLARLPTLVDELCARWSLTVGEPYPESTCSWVAPVGLPEGATAVLKIGLPHFEAEREIAGLRFWDGDGIVRLLDADERRNALLLERCVPGTPARALPEAEQDAILGGLLPRLWRPAPSDAPFRPLSEMLDYWARFTREDEARWPDAAMVRDGLALLAELSKPASGDVVLLTDLHAGNVLRAEREPWLAIDPKPFVGDPAYDATQHLFNCRERLLARPMQNMGDFSARLGVDPERVRLWTFARAAAEPRDDWSGDWRLELARKIAP